MTNSDTLPPDVQELINGHLERVGSALRNSDLTPSEQTAIREDLCGQITEMLMERCDTTPTPADVRAVLGDLDSAEDYSAMAAGNHPSKHGQQRLVSRPMIGAVISVTGIVLPLIYALLTSTETARQQAAVACFLITGFGCVVSITAIREMYREPELERGYLIAFLGAVCLPICFCLWANREIVYPMNSRLMKEVASYAGSQSASVLGPDGSVVRKPISEITDADQIVAPATPAENTRLPFIPWITKGRQVRIFAITTCFGPTFLLTLALAPLAYRKFAPHPVPARTPHEALT